MAFYRACERNPMLDLESAIAAWRQQMLVAGVTASEVLGELESHLREEVDQQMKAGASAQRAFDTAVERIGSARALKEEFDKTTTAGRVLRRQYFYPYCLVAAPLLLLVSCWTLLPGETSRKEGAWGLAAISLVAFYIGSLPGWHGRLPGSVKRLLRTAMLTGNVLVLLWPLLGTFNSLGIIPLELGIVPEMILWSVLAAWFATWLAYAVSGEPYADRNGTRLWPCA